MAQRLKSNVLLAEEFRKHPVDPAGWLISEKLDGIRAVWRSGERRLVSRYGNQLPAPAWFLAGLPANIDLDGELWMGRGQFQRTTSVVRSGSADKGWSDVVYMVFDCPNVAAGGFERRKAAVDDAIAKAGLPHVRSVPHIPCEEAAHLDEAFERVVGAGGEGLMLRKPGSPYAPRRAKYLLKLPAVETADAEIIGYQAGEGRCEGMMGALVCKLESGIVFEIGTGIGFTDDLRRNPPPVGAIITFTCKGTYASGRPRCPSFLTVRDYEGVKEA